MLVAEIFEAIMLISFGAAWPLSIRHSYKSRTSKGKCVWFLYVIILGYLCGMVFQYLITGHVGWMFILFVVNASMVAIDLVLYYRNHHLDKRRDQGEKI